MRSGSALPKGVAEQHRHLAEAIELLQDALGSGDSLARAVPLLDELVEKLSQHFAHEEALMERGGYSGFFGHKHEHEAFLARVRAMRARCDEHHSELLALLAETLHTWFVKHESSSDRRAAEFLKLDEW